MAPEIRKIVTHIEKEVGSDQTLIIVTFFDAAGGTPNDEIATARKVKVVRKGSENILIGCPGDRLSAKRVLVMRPDR